MCDRVVHWPYKLYVRMYVKRVWLSYICTYSILCKRSILVLVHMVAITFASCEGTSFTSLSIETLFTFIMFGLYARVC